MMISTQLGLHRILFQRSCKRVFRQAFSSKQPRELDVVDFITIRPRQQQTQPQTDAAQEEADNKAFGQAVSDLGSGFTRGEHSTIGKGMDFSAALKKRGLLEPAESAHVSVEKNKLRVAQLTSLFNKLLEHDSLDTKITIAEDWLEVHAPDMKGEAVRLVTRYSFPVITTNMDGTKVGTWQ